MQYGLEVTVTLTLDELQTMHLKMATIMSLDLYE